MESLQKSTGKIVLMKCKDCILKYEEPKINYGQVILLIAQQNTSVYAMFE